MNQEVKQMLHDEVNKQQHPVYRLLQLGRQEYPHLRKGSPHRLMYLEAERTGRVDQWQLQRLLADIQEPSTLLNRFWLNLGCALEDVNPSFL